MAWVIHALHAEGYTQEWCNCDCINDVKIDIDWIGLDLTLTQATVPAQAGTPCIICTLVFGHLEPMHNVRRAGDSSCVEW